MTLVDLLMEIIDLLLLHLTVKHYFPTDRGQTSQTGTNISN